MKYVDVILPIPLDTLFTYSVTDEQATLLRPGMRVKVPLGKTKHYMGIVMTIHEALPARLQAQTYEVKPVSKVMDGNPILLPQQLQLWQWIADYYLSPIGEVYKAALPILLKAEDGYRPRTECYVTTTEGYRDSRVLHRVVLALQRAKKQQDVLTRYMAMAGITDDNATPQREVTKEELMNDTHCTTAVLRQLFSKKILRTYEKEVGRLQLDEEAHPERIHTLSDVQEDAYNQIKRQMMRKNVVLLQGVTASGKTEVYIHLIQDAINKGQQVLYLLPEIALTVQIMQRLKHIFGSRLGIFHSRYTDQERAEIWLKQLSDHPYDVILGARSALFVPFQRLGLVIIDEEHESSFKQQDTAPRYHARSAAIVLASLYQAKTLLGTATPSAESYHNAMTGKFGWVKLTQRYKGISLPRIEVVDVKDLRHRKMMKGIYSPQLLAAIRQALVQGEQAIIFQNRRGFAPRVECHDCGWTPRCPHCDVALTYHKNTALLTCHYCGYAMTVPEKCPNCFGKDVRSFGFGTEKIEDELMMLIPEARVARMDLDTTRTKNAYERIIGDFAAGKTNVLIGTQMVTKGLDFDHVSVVGILDADAMLNAPDFRAYEHAFTMLSQVSGRAGRKGKQGLVIMQTRQPQLPVVRQIVGHQSKEFYDDLFDERRLFHYPPFYHLTYVYLKHAQNEMVERAADELGQTLRKALGGRVLGPDKPGVARIKNLYIRKIVLKLENGIDLKAVRTYLRQAQSHLLQSKKYGALQVYYDVDPLT